MLSLTGYRFLFQLRSHTGRQTSRDDRGRCKPRETAYAHLIFLLNLCDYLAVEHQHHACFLRVRFK